VTYSSDMSWQNLITILVGLMVSLVAVISAIVLLRRPRQRDPVQRHYQRFCARLAKLGTVREPNEGPLDFALRACTEQPKYCEQINAVTQLYVAMRYQPQSSTMELRVLKQAVQQL